MRDDVSERMVDVVDVLYMYISPVLWSKRSRAQQYHYELPNPLPMSYQPPPPPTTVARVQYFAICWSKLPDTCISTLSVRSIILAFPVNMDQAALAVIYPGCRSA
jgi:hypothetical protein